MPTSKDPAKAAIQRANLKVGNPSHRAHSEIAVRPLRERYLAELGTEFPSASERRLIIQAHRLAQLELLGAFTDQRGVIRHKRRGDVFPAAALAERIATAFLSEQDRLEALREAGTNGGKPNAQAIIDAYTDGDGET